MISTFLFITLPFIVKAIIIGIVLFCLLIIAGVLICILEELAYKNVLNTQLNKKQLDDFDLKPTKMQKYFVLNKMEKK